MSTLTIEAPEAPPVAPPQPMPSLDPRDLLLRAAAIVRRGWTQDTIAADAHGHPLVDVRAPNATHFCALGAMERALWEAGYLRKTDAGRRVKALWMRLENRVRPEVDGRALTGWNDTAGRTAEQVAEMFERAAR